MFSGGLTGVSGFRKDCTLQMLEMPWGKMRKGSIKCELLKIASHPACITWHAIKLAYKRLHLCGSAALGVLMAGENASLLFSRVRENYSVPVLSVLMMFPVSWEPILQRKWNGHLSLTPYQSLKIHLALMQPSLIDVLQMLSTITSSKGCIG